VKPFLAELISARSPGSSRWSSGSGSPLSRSWN